MRKLTIDVIHGGGQIRAYGPNVAEAIIGFDHGVPLKDENSEKYWALHYFKLNVCKCYTDEDPPPHPFCFELKSMQRIEPNKWRVRAERRYDD